MIQARTSLAFFCSHPKALLTDRWNIGGRRSDMGHPKAFLTGHYGTLVVAEATWATRRRSSQATMEHWWSPERHGPPEGVPHRPHGTLVVAGATWFSSATIA